MSAGGGGAPQQALGAQILVDVRPVNAIAPTGHFPALALFGGCRQKPWIPSERHGYAAAIHQVNGQALIIDMNAANPDVWRDFSHSTPPPPVAPARGASAAPASAPRRSRRDGGAG